MLGNLGVNLNFKRNLFKNQEDKIRRHEEAHKAAAGSLAGPIVIERDSNGIPTGGHVNIKMPPLDPNNPTKTINNAKKIIKSALAPSDPSSQDLKVAAEAQRILLEAKKQRLNQLDYIA